MKRFIINFIYFGILMVGAFFFLNYPDDYSSLNSTSSVLAEESAVSLVPVVEADIEEEPEIYMYAYECDNYDEVEEFEVPVPVIWEATLGGCLVSCYGASFRRTDEEVKHPRFAGYYPDENGKYDWDGGGKQIPAEFLEDDIVLKVYGNWTGVGFDHSRTVFGGLCIPNVEIEKLEIVK